ncbi:predicted protein [Histoplasma capsulatum G186AR]|uniref:Uncharacterized protein n=1 Tax=Ajellomyces capsulatus (strain G186AR / H82 / ATCC MYA-2454 / RMSCC 2432) TaxID=447093 RepID=C0NHR6_AJECG|nr:uncharacterized protein HCBG_02888 [Histoplasma capsulatum G186AR]EEH09351.1 predicted protein [Histoplasma capsulatum G186AR]
MGGQELDAPVDDTTTTEESAAVAKSRRGETVALCIESPGVLNVRLEFGEQQVRTTETGINE